MNSKKLPSSRITWVLVSFVVIISILYLAVISKSLQFWSSNGSTDTSFYFNSGKNIEMTLEPEVMIPTLQVGRARYDNQRIVCPQF